jgi:hypothetical protein
MGKTGTVINTHAGAKKVVKNVKSKDNAKKIEKIVSDKKSLKKDIKSLKIITEEDLSKARVKTVEEYEYWTTSENLRLPIEYDEKKIIVEDYSGCVKYDEDDDEEAEFDFNVKYRTEIERVPVYQIYKIGELDMKNIVFEKRVPTPTPRLEDEFFFGPQYKTKGRSQSFVADEKTMR